MGGIQVCSRWSKDPEAPAGSDVIDENEFDSLDAYCSPTGIGSHADRGLSPGSAGCDPTVYPCVVKKTRRWVKVLQWHVARGMDSTFFYRKGSRNTKTDIAYRFGSGPWRVNGRWKEAVKRRSSVDIPKSGPYHRVRFMRYRYYKWKEVLDEDCPSYVDPEDCFHPVERWWEPHHWTGGSAKQSDWTPDQGAINWDVAERLPVGWIARRSTDENANFAIGLRLAGLELGSRAGYHTTTEVQWTGTSGCPHKRWLWGKNRDWTQAYIVQASCASKPS